MPIPELLRRLLARYLDLERPEPSNTKQLLVVLKGKQRGQPMTTSGLRSLFRYRRRETELHNANAHRFRHTFGADMARAGVRLPILQRMMGHAQAETTLKYINLAMTDIAAEYRVLIGELEQFNPELLEKRRLLAITKSDMIDEELEVEMRQSLPADVPAIFISSLANKNIVQLKDMIWKALHE